VVPYRPSGSNVKLTLLQDATVYKIVYSAVAEKPESTRMLLKKLVGANGFEPSTSWSRRRRWKTSKCRIWCRLRDRTTIYPALEVDGSWTEFFAAHIDQRWPTMRHSFHRLREPYVDASGPLRCARLTHALARRECAVLQRWWRRFAKPTCPVCTR
jgi:hypothetical protein